MYIHCYVFHNSVSEVNFFARYSSDHNGNKTFSFFVLSLPFGYFAKELPLYMLDVYILYILL